MFSENITFFVFTFNESARLDAMLKALEGHGKIVVIDNFSTDDTAAIARRYTSSVFQHKNIGYVENEHTMRFISELLGTPWAYLCYVDEFIPLDLMKLLKDVANGTDYDAVEIYRKNFMYGREVFNYGKHHLRMFKSGAVDFSDNIVHKLGVYSVDKSRVFRAPISMNTVLWHMSAYNTDRLELSHNRYANIEAEQRHAILSQRFSGFRAVWKLIFYFFGTYIGLGGFRGGWPGFFISVQIAYFKFSIEARLWEIDNGVTLEAISEKYDTIRETIIVDRCPDENEN